MKTGIRTSWFLLYLFSTMILVGGCKTEKGSFKTKFGSLPASCSIQEYWWSGAGLDHSYIWKLRFVSVEDIDGWIGSLAGYESIKNLHSWNAGLISSAFPSWWDRDHLSTLEGLRKEGDRVGRFIFVDRDVLVVYLQWFDT